MFPFLFFKGQISSSIKYGHENLCKMKIYATFRTLGLISVVSYFKFWFPCGETISVCTKLWFYVLCNTATQFCSRSCTLIKDVDFVSGRPGFQIPTPSFLSLMLVWGKKKIQEERKLLNSKQALKFEFNRI